MSRMKQLTLQFARFSAVGTTCSLIDWGLMILLTELTPMEYFYSAAVSFIVSTILNYILSMRFVFRGREDISRTQEAALFVVLSAIGLGLNQMILWIVVNKLRVYYIFAKVIATIIVSLYNFISRKVFME